MSISLIRLFIIASLLLTISACSFQRTTWKSTLAASPDAVEAALHSDKNYPYLLDRDHTHTPNIESPSNLRPCCAFGMDIKSKIVQVTVPFYRVANIIEVDDLGPHTYDAGFLGHGTDKQVESNENNGLIYTCEGGFIDTAHVRDYADWTVFFFSWISHNQARNAALQLPAEIGNRTLRLKAYENSILSPVEQRQLNIALAQWLAYQLSVWHEIAQWHGLTTIEGFPEDASAYSVEDLYSNVLGTQIAAALISGMAIATDQQYSRNMDTWIRNTLHHLHDLPVAQSRAYMAQLDQHWWDSSQRLPDKFVVLKRNYDVGAQQLPPRLPPQLRPLLSEEMQQACPEQAPPRYLRLQESYAGFDFAELAALEIDILEEYRDDFTYPDEIARAANHIDQSDFPTIASMNKTVDEPQLQEHLESR